MHASAQAFGQDLRRYRRASGQSQLQAALTAGVSQRHLSFLESGRAQPSRGMVLALGAALGLSLAQQNELLLAARYAPIFRPEHRDPAELEMVERALHAFLDAHDPFPALLVRDEQLIARGNRGAARLLSAVTGEHIPAVPENVWNVFDLLMQEGPIRERLENWSTTAAWLLRRHAAKLAQHTLPAASALAATPEVKRLLRQESGEPPGPVLPLNFRLDDARLSLFSVIASLQAPLDTRLEDLRVELFIPADTATADWFRAAV